MCTDFILQLILSKPLKSKLLLLFVEVKLLLVGSARTGCNLNSTLSLKKGAADSLSG